MSAAGEPDGVSFDFDRVPNTVGAHRMILHAAAQNRQWEMADALFRGYFSEGRHLNDAEDLAAIAARAGLDPDETRELLAGDRGTPGTRGRAREGPQTSA